MVTLDKADLKRAEIKDSSVMSTAELLIIQRASLLERLKNIRTEEISSVDADAPTAKLWNDSLGWHNEWPNTWDTNWHNHADSLKEKRQKQDDEEKFSINPKAGTI